MTDPVVSAAMIDHVTRGSREALDRLADDALRQAYVAGVIDGYAQAIGAQIAGRGIAGDGPGDEQRD